MPVQANRWIFQASDSINGAELWITDGTAAGTQLLKNINPGSASSLPQFLAPFGSGQLLFSATDSSNGRELWITDGTSAGTQRLADISQGTASSSPQNFTDLGNGTALFTATTGGAGAELWVTDGTQAGTQLLKDLFPGASGSVPQNFTAIGNGKWLFSANDGTSGRELWVTDGTADGTVLVKDIFTGSGNSTPTEITPIGNGRALFNAASDVGGNELWITDGTAAGTVLVRDIIPGTESSDPQAFTALGDGRWIFVADDNVNGTELWVTDGSAVGTSLVANIAAGAVGSFPLNLTALGNGKVLFTADNATNGSELWITDGSAAGTVLLADIAPGVAGSSILYLTAIGGGKAVFRANDGASGSELWVTDGTSGGTHLVMDIRSGTGSSAPQFITAIGDGRALFRANDGTKGAELWITDGTALGTHLVKDIRAGTTGSSPTGFTGILIPNHAPVLGGPGAVLVPGVEDQFYALTAGQLLQGYLDPDGDSLSVTGLTVDRGTLTDNGAGSWTYHPEADYSGPVSFAYTVSDGHGGTIAASLNLILEPVNDVPIAQADTLAAMEDSAITYTAAQLLGNDTDADGDALSIASVTSGVGGTVVLNADGSVTFTPAENFYGAASFTYTAQDGSSTSTPVTVTVNVAAVNDVPIAQADTLAAVEDTAITYTAAQLLGNDTDADGDVLSIASVTSGVGGTAVLNADGSVTFTPTENFHGAASFSYTAKDGSSTSTPVTVTVNVAAVNDVPIAQADTLAAVEDTAITYTAAQLLGNDTDADGDALSIASVTSGVGGTVVLNADGSVTFTPAENFYGAASFTYTAQDGSSTSTPVTVTVNVAAVNDPAVIGGVFTGNLAEDADPNSVSGTLTIDDPDSATAFQAATVPTLSDSGYGSFTVTAEGVWTYVLNNANTAVDALNAGGQLVDTFSVLSADGTVRQVVITIAGHTDNPAAAPTDIRWLGIDAGSGALPSVGGPMATLSTVDADSATFTYALQAGSSAGFSINGATVSPTAALATGQTYSLIIRSTDSTNQGHTETFTVITGTAAVNSIAGTAGDDAIYALGGNDTLSAGAGDDVTYGGDGNDIFLASAGDGNDTYVGGAGIDTYSLANTTASATVDLGAGTASSAQTGTDALAFIENATGGSGDDVLIGSAGVANVLAGGLGNDTYHVQDATDVVSEATAQGVDTVFASVSYMLTNSVENLVLTGTGNINATGSASANVLTGNSGNNVLDGGAGADTMAGGAGDDTYVINLGTDVVTELAGEGNDTVMSPFSYVLGANMENGTLTGTGNNVLTGNDLDNVITGNSGNNQLNGLGGVDVLIGGGGNDTYISRVTPTGALEDTIIAGSGIDTLVINGSATLATATTIATPAAIENISISGTSMTLLNVTGNELGNTLTGNGAANILSGGLGNDTLIGGGGSDRLVGGAGIDTLTGGNARDTFAFAAGDSSALGATVDRITDLLKGAVGTGDLIDYTVALTRGGSALAASATEASINQATGVATFAADSGGTLADAVNDIAARFTAAGDAAGECALFQVNATGNYHLYISDGVAGVGANDVVVEVVGVTAVSQTNLSAAGDLTIVA